MKKVVWIGLLGFIFQTSQAQFQWSVNLGGGVTYLDNILDNFPWPRYTGGSHFLAGTSIGSIFTKEGMVSWEAGLNIFTSAYYLVPDKGREVVPGFIDIGKRVGYTENLFSDAKIYRDLGGSVNIRYTIR